jgi:Rho GDP-dissociation inhibitor
MSETPTPPPPPPPAPPAPLAAPAPSALPVPPESSDDDPRPTPRIDTAVIGDDTDPDYKPPEKKTVEELLGAKEGEDEALQRYKQQLLGVAATGGGKTDDPRRVVITKLELLINGRPEPLSFDMSKESNLNGKLTVQIKEGCEYKTQLTFRVQNELISGLKYKNTVAGASSGIVLLRVNEMLGSYGPDPQKTNVFVFPRREWEEGTRPTLEAARTPCRSALPAHPPVISQPDGRTSCGRARPPCEHLIGESLLANSSERHDGEGDVQVHHDLCRRRWHDAPHVQLQAGDCKGLFVGRKGLRARARGEAGGSDPPPPRGGGDGACLDPPAFHMVAQGGRGRTRRGEGYPYSGEGCVHHAARPCGPRDPIARHPPSAVASRQRRASACVVSLTEL